MILRESTDSWLLVSQVDHAQLAGDLAGAWGNEQVAGLPLSEMLLPAIRDHDEGWRNWEAAPGVTEEGLPREFTEMPAAAAAAIWNASIECCAGGFPSLAEALRRLRSAGGEVTPDDAIVLDAIHSCRGSFNIERLTRSILGEGDLTGEAVAASLARLEARQVIRPLSNVVGGPAAAIELPTAGSSPLGGIWVSRHFTALAESAKANRDDPGELAEIDEFLAEQTARQEEWSRAARDFAGEELERVIDTGFRYVQFFDRISLWLCMAERSDPWQATLSSSLTLTFTPRSPREIAVDPWPFGPGALELWSPAVRIPDERHADSDALKEALRSAEQTALRWVLVGG